MANHKGIMCAKPFSEKRIQAWETDKILVQPKLNGMRCEAYHYGKWHLMSSENKPIPLLPHIEELLNMFPKEHTYAGELYRHGTSLQQIMSLCRRTVNKHPFAMFVQYHLFDIADPTKTQEDRLTTLNNIFNSLGDTKQIHFVRTYKIDNTPSAIKTYYNLFLKGGFEGIILRNPKAYYKRGYSNDLLKIKRYYQDTVDIIAPFEAVDKNGYLKNTLGGFTVLLEGQKPFNIGCGKLTESTKNVLWTKYKANPKLFLNASAVIKYPEKSTNGTPLQSVLMEVSVETNGQTVLYGNSTQGE